MGVLFMILILFGLIYTQFSTVFCCAVVKLNSKLCATYTFFSVWITIYKYLKIIIICYKLNFLSIFVKIKIENAICTYGSKKLGSGSIVLSGYLSITLRVPHPCPIFQGKLYVISGTPKNFSQFSYYTSTVETQIMLLELRH